MNRMSALDVCLIGALSAVTMTMAACGDVESTFGPGADDVDGGSWTSSHGGVQATWTRIASTEFQLDLTGLSGPLGAAQGEVEPPAGTRCTGVSFGADVLGDWVARGSSCVVAAVRASAGPMVVRVRLDVPAQGVDKPTMRFDAAAFSDTYDSPRIQGWRF